MRTANKHCKSICQIFDMAGPEALRGLKFYMPGTSPKKPLCIAEMRRSHTIWKVKGKKIEVKDWKTCKECVEVVAFRQIDNKRIGEPIILALRTCTQQSGRKLAKIRLLDL